VLLLRWCHQFDGVSNRTRRPVLRARARSTAWRRRFQWLLCSEGRTTNMVQTEETMMNRCVARFTTHSPTVCRRACSVHVGPK